MSVRVCDQDNVITVTYFVRSDDRASRQSKFVELYVNRIPETVDETRLRQHFEAVGTVTSAVIMKNREVNIYMCFYVRALSQNIEKPLSLDHSAWP